MKKIIEKKYIQCTFIFLTVILSYIIWSISDGLISTGIIKTLMAVLVAAAAVFLIICCRKKRLTADTAIKAVIFAGIVMRIGYMLYTPCDLREHDLRDISADSYGHAAYLLGLIQNSSLPQSNDIEFYQQPFFYIAGSIVSKLINAVTANTDAFSYVDAVKTVSCAVSCMILIIALSIFDMFMLKGKEKFIAMLIVAFHPSFFLGTRVTPDMLSAFFMTLALLFTFRWYNTPDWKNTVILAFIYGLGVMTKISVSVIALFTAVVFAVKIFENIKENKTFSIILKLVIFGFISLPLGLWYSVRNKIRFDQDFFYVLKVSEDVKTSIYIGDRSLVERFVIPDFKSIFTTPYGNVSEDYNYFVYNFKTSLFGEFIYDVPSIIPIVLFLSALILSVIAAYSVVYALKRRNENKMCAVLAALFVFFIGSSIVFSYRYPDACSMDFRYSIFLVIPAAILFVKYLMRITNETIKQLIYTCIAVYSFSSCAMYILI